MLRRVLFLVTAGGLALVPRGDAGACSCIDPDLLFVGPDRSSEAPLNAHVRIEVPAPTTQPVDVVVRASATGQKVDVTERRIKDGSLSLLDLVPTKPLAPATRYEVATIDRDPTAYPRTIVVGSFRTGGAVDATPPKIDAVGSAIARGNSGPSSMCGIRGPWLEVAGLRASDPGRADASLMFAVWTGDAAGNVDTTKAPAALVSAHGDLLTIGQSSLCDPHGFAIPQGATSITIAIAAVDEAGNQSAARRLPKIALGGAVQGGRP